jgi:hypothetical protein
MDIAVTTFLSASTPSTTGAGGPNEDRGSGKTGSLTQPADSSS